MKRSLFFLFAVFFISAQAAQHLSDEENTIHIYKQIAPRVVFVHNLKTVMMPNFDLSNIPVGAGSGFIWNEKGYVVTNFHVIQGASRLAVTLGKDKTYPAKLVGVEPRQDIAVLKIKAPDQVIDRAIKGRLPIADSNRLAVGQKTIAIGNPFGLSRTLTTGIVSALGRQISSGLTDVSIRNIIQTDATINPGNSGGPLLDSHGRLIGMNTMIFSTTGSSAGIGFAIPSNEIKNTVEQLIKHGRVIQSGIGIERFSDEFAAQLGVEGVIIKTVMPNTPAAKAKLKPAYLDDNGRLRLGDVIIGVNNEKIAEFDDLYYLLEHTKVGALIELKVLRNGKPRTVKLKTVDIFARRG